MHRGSQLRNCLYFCPNFSLLRWIWSCCMHSAFICPPHLSFSVCHQRINAYLSKWGKDALIGSCKIHDWKNLFSAKLILEALQRKTGQISCSHRSGWLPHVWQWQHPCCSKRSSAPPAESRAALGAMPREQRGVQHFLPLTGSAEKQSCRISMRPKY